MSGQLSKNILSVSDLTRKIKLLLEEKFPMVWICGEISNYRLPSSGHAYFSLKDDKAQISAVMFRGQRRHLKFDLEDGITIVGLGRVSLYEPRGTYQIILEYAEPKGVGALQIAFEQLKRKLELEGLFDAASKKKMPFLPNGLCVVTSPTGAVVRDIINVALRRFPGMPIQIVPVRVQGDLAATQIAHAIKIANDHKQSDLIILARGGGSLEDLQAFNSEVVARAIFASDIPIISAVGHETDYTIADFVADLRAPTPSAAAELAVPVKTELQAHCAQLRHRCRETMISLIERYYLQLAHLSRSIVHPIKKVQEFQIRTDDMRDRLQRAMKICLRSHQYRFNDFNSRLFRYNPEYYIQKYKPIIDIFIFKILELMNKRTINAKGRLDALQATLEALSPLHVLRRGYSITRKMPPDQRVVSNADAVDKGEKLQILLAQGKLKVTVD